MSKFLRQPLTPEDLRELAALLRQAFKCQDRLITVSILEHFALTEVNLLRTDTGPMSKSLRLTLDIAEKFLEDSAAVDLEQFNSITNDAAAALTGEEELSLNGLTSLSAGPHRTGQTHDDCGRSRYG
jgi:hypothetical protein